MEKKYYYGYSTEEARKSSSSGGIFWLLAKKVLNMGGVVFGAVYSSKTQTVIYKNTEEVSLERLMRSKYVQADLGTTFLQVENFLREGKYVLFCGTPCYVAGLKRYIVHKDNTLSNKLLLIDFLCEGVPSKKVFIAYQNYIEKINGDKVVDVIFRSKKYGWRLHCMNIKFQSSKEYTRIWWNDLYMCAFLKGIILNRQTCYMCKFRENKEADITLGDFWAAEKYDLNCKDNKGTSVVIVNTQKGCSFIDMTEYNNLKTLDLTKAHLAHQDLTNVLNYIDERNAFYKDFNKYGFKSAIMKHCDFMNKLTKAKKAKLWITYRIKIPFVNSIKYWLSQLGVIKSEF